MVLKMSSGSLGAVTGKRVWAGKACPREGGDQACPATLIHVAAGTLSLCPPYIIRLIVDYPFTRRIVMA